MPAQPPQVLDREHQPTVALDLLQVAALMAQQALVVLVAGGDAGGYWASVIYVICPTRPVTESTPLDGRDVGATLSPL